MDSTPAKNPRKPESLGSFLTDVKGSKSKLLLVLFGVTGILGLPLLWSSDRFTPREKWIWSLITTAYTLSLVVITLSIVVWAYQNIVGNVLF